eukprot:CAMPEP_0178910782 /NCGR_PEP_ID=MMETSP0786-20121207/9292_1 /TAXON_ID=186022 /ORGANISM="Thalassionema frauenfeldii, Strain CCMP 1798" /LENGTH=535 /DNA_ID=CAMNT_0020583079 /DNA_START=80 /DNA_END=1687 /DNA_ORIENTATION=-
MATRSSENSNPLTEQDWINNDAPTKNGVRIDAGSVDLDLIFMTAFFVIVPFVPALFLIYSFWTAPETRGAIILWSLLQLILLPGMRVKKLGLLGHGLFLVRSFALPLYILNCTVSPLYTGIWFVLRCGLAVASYLVQPSSRDDKKLSILLSGDSFFPKVDGVATFTSHTIQQMLKKGHKVHVVTSKQGPSNLYGAPVTRIPGLIPYSIDPHHSMTLPLPWHMLPPLFKIRPHVVHMYESIVPITLGMAVCLWYLDIPFVISHHTRIDMYAKFICPWLPKPLVNVILVLFYGGIHRLATLNLGVCPPLLDWLQYTKAWFNLPPQLWISGVNVAQFSPSHRCESMRQRLMNTTDKNQKDLPLIIYVGRMAQEKDSSELIPLFEKLYAKQKVHVALVGGGPMKELLQEQAKDLDYIHFVGYLRGDDLYQAYASADLFCSPSTTEGFPLVFLESLASGTPVVGANEGGSPLVFSNEDHGRLFPPHDLDAAVHAIQQVIQQTGTKMSDDCATHAHSFTWERSIGELEQHYHRVVERGQYL